MDNDFSVRIPMFGKNKYPMAQFKDFDPIFELEQENRRREEWNKHVPRRRLKATDWHPQFLAISDSPERNDYDI